MKTQEDSIYVDIQHAFDLQKIGYNDSYSKVYDINKDKKFPIDYIKGVTVGDSYVPAPTKSDVVNWLLLNKNIWVEVTMGRDEVSVWFDYDIFKSTPSTSNNFDDMYKSLIDDEYEAIHKVSSSTPNKAYSDAFEYILDKLVHGENI